MARFLCPPLLVLVLLLSGGSPAAAPAAAAAGAVQGDVTCEGTVNSVDALQVLRSVASLSTSADCLAEAADVDCSGDVGSVDALKILRFVAGLPNAPVDGCVPIGEPLEAPPTSEALIAAALEAGDITYEESLLARAYALFDDPRLQDEFRSPIIDWEAGSELFNEVDENEATLSAELLADLAPFRARPNDPISIFNNPPQGTGLAAPGPASAFGWQSDVIPGTNARVWTLGAPGVHEQYMDEISTVWSAMLGIFIYPNADQAGDPNLNVNPDGAIDFYFVNPGIDPRHTECEVNPDPDRCLTASDYGMARRAPPFVGNTSSGYLVVNLNKTGDGLIGTLAHELTHVSQYSYDKGEASWLYESTATWAEYRVMKDLGKTPKYAYDWARDLYKGLDKPLNRDGNEYGSWLFFLHASMERGDVIVSDVWEKAKPPGRDGIRAVDQAFKLEDNFGQFAVRNWNEKPPLDKAYKDAPDNTFPQDLHPEPDREKAFAGEGDDTWDLPVRNLSAVYYRYTFEAPVRYISVENNLWTTDGAHVWLLKKIGGQWKPPQDLKGVNVVTFCRDSTEVEEDLSELIVIVSNSKITGDLPSQIKPRVVADLFGCVIYGGVVETTLTMVEDYKNITYRSRRVGLLFVPRKVQDTEQVILYDAIIQPPGEVVWEASGTYGGCSVEGQMTVSVDEFQVPYTPNHPAGGLLSVTAVGDWHAVWVAAWDPEATFTVTCPDQWPYPNVFEESFGADIYLLLTRMEPNTNDGGKVIFKGEQVDVFDVFGDGSRIETYHFKWELRPIGGAGP